MPPVDYTEEGRSSAVLLTPTSSSNKDQVADELIADDHYENYDSIQPVKVTTNLRQAWSEYYKTPEFFELLSCIAILIVGRLLPRLHLNPHERTIPYQQLESTGEYIVNQAFNEVFEGETLSSKSNILYAE